MCDKLDSFSNDNCINKKKSYEENEFVKREQIKTILAENGIHSYDPRVVTHLNDYINNYTTEVLTNATTFAIHAGRKTVNTSDVKLALEMISKKSFSKRLSRKELMELAKHHNQTQLPKCNFLPGIPVPSEGSVLTNCNYKLKSPTIPYQVSIPLMDDRQNQVLTLNPIKSYTGVTSTVTRPSATIPLNLNPQRIILKPSNNIMLHSSSDKNVKKRKHAEMRK